jgi:hypothetical protein
MSIFDFRFKMILVMEALEKAVYIMCVVTHSKLVKENEINEGSKRITKNTNKYTESIIYFCRVRPKTGAQKYTMPIKYFSFFVDIIRMKE